MEGMITEGLLYLVIPYNYLLFFRWSMVNITEVKNCINMEAQTGMHCSCWTNKKYWAVSTGQRTVEEKELLKEIEYLAKHNNTGNLVIQ
jgi:hypothetical protein